MKRIILLVTLILSACQTKIATPRSQTAGFATSAKTQTVSSEKSISTTGIGRAKLGMTLKRLRKISDRNTQFQLIPSFIENVDAIAVTQKGIVQYYILYDANGDTQSNSSETIENRLITSLVTNNDNYQTEHGVRVGTSIREAEDIYGDAVLAYNTEGKAGEEYVTFGAKNPDNIKFKASYFKLISDGLGYSGIYPEYPGVSYTTDKYRADAAIAAIEVSCNPDNCIN